VNRIRVRRSIGITTLFVSLPVLIWGILPPRIQVRDLGISLSESRIKPSPNPNSSLDQVDSKLIIEWPSWSRVGDIYEINLRLDIDNPLYSLSTEENPADTLENGSFNESDFQEMSGFLIESRLDIPGIHYQPIGDVREALYPGQPVKFLWSLRPPKIGRYRGTIWLYSWSAPLEPTVKERSVLTTQRIEIQVVSLLSMGGKTARVIGVVGTVIGSLSGLDGVFTWFWNSLIRVLKPAKIPS